MPKVISSALGGALRNKKNLEPRRHFSFRGILEINKHAQYL